jgi:hypothetical protein
MGEPAEESAQRQEDRKVDVAIRRFDILVRHIATEESLTWTGCQLFAVANGVLITFCAARFPQNRHLIALAPLLAVSVLGYLLSRFWQRFMERAPSRTNRWIKLGLEIEAVAFGGLEVLPCPGRGRHSMLDVARGCVILWVVMAGSLGLAFASNWVWPGPAAASAVALTNCAATPSLMPATTPKPAPMPSKSP